MFEKGTSIAGDDGLARLHFQGGNVKRVVSGSRRTDQKRLDLYLQRGRLTVLPKCKPGAKTLPLQSLVTKRLRSLAMLAVTWLERAYGGSDHEPNYLYNYLIVMASITAADFGSMHFGASQSIRNLDVPNFLEPACVSLARAASRCNSFTSWSFKSMPFS